MCVCVLILFVRRVVAHCGVTWASYGSLGAWVREVCVEGGGENTARVEGPPPSVAGRPSSIRCCADNSIIHHGRLYKEL